MTTGGVFTDAFIRANPIVDEPVCGPHGDCGPDGVPHSLIAVDDRLYVGVRPGVHPTARSRVPVKRACRAAGASQPTSRAGHRRLRAEPRRDWARR